MSKTSLKVVVAGRTYPLSVKESEQEAILAAAEEINNSIKVLKDNYAVKDIQDLLAMSALQIATKSKQNTGSNSLKDTSSDNDILKQRLLDLTSLVDSKL
jgi:cell division protein ZapA